VGDAATLLLPDPWHGPNAEIIVLRPGEEPERRQPERVDPYARELEELSAAVEGGPPPRLGREDALGQARAIDALYRAAAEGRAVTL
jgi:D-xylose 1-dehydrogenase (NADP+, D-xylono-1,5-lactone-forming)